MTFRVHSMVAEDSEWGRQDYAGHSSVGYLAAGSINSATDIEVDCVAADNELPADIDVGFIKLDAQGGELNALHGMKKLLRNTRLMWVEFTNQPGLLDLLTNEDFVVFDTEYFLMGEKNDAAFADFNISKQDVIYLQVSTHDLASEITLGIIKARHLRRLELNISSCKLALFVLTANILVSFHKQ